MTLPSPPPCWICGSPSIGVRSSPLGAISGAYCLDCLEANREPWGVLVGCLMGCERGEVADWVKPIIKATLAFYNKTEDDLWNEVEKEIDEMDDYYRREEQEKK